LNLPIQDSTCILKAFPMPKNTLTLTGLAVLLAITVGGMLYLLPLNLEVAPLYGGSSIGSDTTNVGYPP
jgi:hypothetical protein